MKGQEGNKFMKDWDQQFTQLRTSFHNHFYDWLDAFEKIDTDNAEQLYRLVRIIQPANSVRNAKFTINQIESLFLDKIKKSFSEPESNLKELLQQLPAGWLKNELQPHFASIQKSLNNLRIIINEGAEFAEENNRIDVILGDMFRAFTNPVKAINNTFFSKDSLDNRAARMTNTLNKLLLEIDENVNEIDNLLEELVTDKWNHLHYSA